MSAAPRVSVIIPTHNRAQLVVRAIESVLAQTWRDLELIVVDDASTDNTPAAVAAIRDPRLRYVRHDRSRYAAGARNSGLRAARGALIAFHDDDDIWLAEKLERQVAALDAAEFDVGVNLCGHVCYTRGRIFYVGGQDWFRRLDHRVFRLRDSALVATPGWLVRRSAIDAAGLFDETLPTWEDWELLLRLAQVCRLSHTDMPLFIQDRVKGGGVSRDEGQYAAAMRHILSRHAALWRDHPRTLARHYLVVGRYEALRGSAAEARRWLARALRLAPALPQGWMLYALALLGDGRAQRVREAWHALRTAIRRRTPATVHR